MPLGAPFVSLGSDRVSTWGFDNHKWIEAALNKVGLRSAEPTIDVRDDAVLVPSIRRLDNDLPPEPRFVGGVIDSDGSPVPSAQWRRLGRSVISGVPESIAASVAVAHAIDEEVVWLGWMQEHYGHFLLEGLARIWYLAHVDPRMRVFFHLAPHGWPNGTICRALELFEVPSTRALVVDVPTRMKRIHIPEQLYELGFAAHERTAQSFRSVASRIVGPPDPIPSQQPVYLSRRLLPSHRREAVGEGELEELLRENGFLIAYPERMAFEDQVRLFNRHSDIFACEGSALHGVLFALHQPRIHVLMGRAIPPDYLLTSAAAGTHLTMVRCLDSRHTSFRSRLIPEMIDLPRIAEYLAEQGFLRHPQGASVAARQARVRTLYDESWMCNQVGHATAHAVRLSPDEEEEAMALAAWSWQVAWRLLAYWIKFDAGRVEPLVRQFAVSVSSEHDSGRLSRYKREIGRTRRATLEKLCPVLSEDARELLDSTIRERFPLR